jgi:hypothetical protein
MNLKSQAIADLKVRLNKELSLIRCEMNSNKYQIKKLADRQSLLKKELKEVYSLIRSLDMKPKDIINGKLI